MIAMLPVVTSYANADAAIFMNPNWVELDVVTIEGEHVLDDLGPDEWRGINPWSGCEFKVSPLQGYA